MFRKILITLLIFLILLGSYFWVTKKSTLENFLSERLNAEVKIEDISISYRGIFLQNVTIKNLLPSYPFMTINKVEMELAPWAIFPKTTKIKRLKIYNPTIYVNVLEGSDENSMTSFLLSVPDTRDKLFSVGEIYLYVIEFVATEGGKGFNIWPIPFLALEKIPERESLGNLMKLMMKKVIENMISKHPLPFKTKSRFLRPENNLQAPT